jgi:hypothetical protein
MLSSSSGLLSGTDSPVHANFETPAILYLEAVFFCPTWDATRIYSQEERIKAGQLSEFAFYVGHASNQTVIAYSGSAHR